MNLPWNYFTPQEGNTELCPLQTSQETMATSFSTNLQIIPDSSYKDLLPTTFILQFYLYTYK